MGLQGEETWAATELLEQFVAPYKQGSTEISVLTVAPLRTVVLGPAEIECWV